MLSIFKRRTSMASTAWLVTVAVIYLCQSFVTSQRLNPISCERRPTHTSAHKTPGDNGFSIKILGRPPPQYYEPGQDYEGKISDSLTLALWCWVILLFDNRHRLVQQFIRSQLLSGLILNAMTDLTSQRESIRYTCSLLVTLFVLL